MVIGQVIDSIWCTRKDEALRGLKFMKIKLMDRDGGEAIDGIEGSVIVAVDLIGAGIGEIVLITQGSSARKFNGLENSPIDSIVVGIIDAKGETKEGGNER